MYAGGVYALLFYFQKKAGPAFQKPNLNSAHIEIESLIGVLMIAPCICFLGGEAGKGFGTHQCTVIGGWMVKTVGGSTGRLVGCCDSYNVTPHHNFFPHKQNYAARYYINQLKHLSKI